MAVNRSPCVGIVAAVRGINCAVQLAAPATINEGARERERDCPARHINNTAGHSNRTTVYTVQQPL